MFDKGILRRIASTEIIGAKYFPVISASMAVEKATYSPGVPHMLAGRPALRHPRKIQRRSMRTMELYEVDRAQTGSSGSRKRIAQQLLEWTIKNSNTHQKRKNNQKLHTSELGQRGVWQHFC